MLQTELYNVLSFSTVSYSCPLCCLRKSITDLSAFLAEQANDFDVPCCGSETERCHATVSGPIHNSTHFKEQSNHLHMPQMGVNSQDGGVSYHLCTPGDTGTSEHQQAANLEKDRDKFEGIIL